jgi:hypothetical protein
VVASYANWSNEFDLALVDLWKTSGNDSCNDVGGLDGAE